MSSQPLPPPPSPPCFLSGVGGEQTAADVHATLCALVTAEAAQHSAWAEYAAVLLDEGTASFFAARLTEGKGVSDGDESSPPSKKTKKRKLETSSKETDSAAASDADPDITLRVACLDGSSLDLTVPPRELVREVKRAIGQVRRRLVGLLCIRRVSHGNILIWYSLALFLHAAVVVSVNDPPTLPFPAC